MSERWSQHSETKFGCPISGVQPLASVYSGVFVLRPSLGCPLSGPGYGPSERADLYPGPGHGQERAQEGWL